MSASKMSLLPIDLTAEVDKFLNYMENIESCSQLTLKAYRLDLCQAFPDPVKKAKLWTEAELLTQARQALQNWGSLSPI